jgi:DNA-directed RNA polymerase subunit M/transcription elongation factor TFIIS
MENNNLDIEDIVLQNQQLIDANLQYQQILEKTNSQLGLWGNPYSTSVAVLGVLFTVLTIVAATIIWWQSGEHKKMLREELDNVINKQRKEALQAIELLKTEKEKEIKNSADEQKTVLINQLENLKNKELELKVGLPDLSQYMKKEDYLCENCQNNNMLSFRNILRVNDYYVGYHKKCVSCGNNF